ncbi:MAG: metallophosphoesterase [Xanthomonadales bacterium]|nr:metallophosphoesterase [Xanthomonadales bacterium]
MNGSIHIAQITDCHLPAARKTHYRGIDAWANLERLLARLKAHKPDLVLATGDLSEDASTASYRGLRDLFWKLRVPVLALPGNHDDADLMAQFFPSSPSDTPCYSYHGGWQIIRLNSCATGKPHGRLSDNTLQQLQATLEQDSGRPRLLALHHQPVLVNSPWIDKHRLLEPEPLLQLIDGHADIKAVVWGHVHQVFEADRNGVAMLGSPSSAINGVPGMDTFTADTLAPACRWLELRGDGSLESRIVSA